MHQCGLGMYYMEGSLGHEGVEPDMKRAIELLTLVAEQGCTNSQCCLGPVLATSMAKVQKRHGYGNQGVEYSCCSRNHRTYLIIFNNSITLTLESVLIKINLK